MKLIIDIPEKIVTAIQNGEDYRYDIHTAIAQGIPYEPKGDLISREALKEKLKPCEADVCEFSCEGCHFRVVTAEDIDNAPTVTVNCEDCDGYEAGYSAGLKDAEIPHDIFPMEIVAGKCPIEAGGNCPLKSQGEWIPVSERFPHFSGLYLVSVDDLVTVANFGGAYFINKIGLMLNVSAWQHLPEPYKKGGAE